MRKSILLLMAVLLTVSPAFAMSVTHLPDYNTYKPVGWNTYTGVPIDDSASGMTFYLGDGYSNYSSFDLNSPDGTNSRWWVWLRLINQTESGGTQIMDNPPDVRFRVLCGSSGGWFNITSAGGNLTWSSGYSLWYLDWDTEEMLQYAEQIVSPTGKDLYGLSRDCYLEIDGSTLPASSYAKVSVWAESPSREAVCETDESIDFIKSATLGIIDINYQIWSMAFNVLVIVIILLAFFGIPIILIRVVRKLIDELSGKKRKAF